MSGFDLRMAELPGDVRILTPRAPLPAIEDFRAAVATALEEPLDGEPFSTQLRQNARVTVVLDDFTLPVPPTSRDCRREMLEVVLGKLAQAGVRSDRISVLVANGLARQWRSAELTEMLGPQLTSAQPISCHDAEAQAQLVRIGDEPEGPVELNRAVVEADLVVYLNVVTLPVVAGLMGLVSGTAGYRTARFLGAPSLFEKEDAPLVPGSAYHRIHERVGARLLARTKLVQLSVVLNNELWAPALSALLHVEPGLSRPLQVWNTLPGAVRHRAARLLKSSYRPFAVFAGSTDAVVPRALEAFRRQYDVPTPAPAQVLVFGLPDQGPYSVRSAQNPVLAAHLALGHVANLFSGRPMLEEGGVIIFANPLQPEFDRRYHQPHEDFYEKVLRLEREPSAIHERFEPFFAGRPEFVSGYERRFAFHGAHPLYAWYQCAPARRRAGRIIVAHADPRACARLGLTPANDIDDAMVKAREHLGTARPSTLVLELPPAFWVRVGA